MTAMNSRAQTDSGRHNRA